MIHRPRPKFSLLALAGGLLKLFAIGVVAFAVLLFFLLLFNAPGLGEVLVHYAGPLLVKSGMSIVVLILAGIFIESLQ